MGRYNKRGHRQGKKWGKKNYKQNNAFTDTDLILIEQYLKDYRTNAYDLYYNRGKVNQHVEEDDSITVVIGKHKFPVLTTEVCILPYINMPATLNGKQRKMIHALCTQLDIYHAGVGNDDKYAINTSSEGSINNDQVNTTNDDTVILKRRIAISIYADGIDHVPDYSTEEQVHSFPSYRCKPWYFLAYINTDNVQNTDIQLRIDAIESETKQITQFFNLPETSLRTLETDKAVDSIDLRVLDNFDLSMCPDLKETPYVLVNTVEKLRLCADELASCSELAFDCEMCNAGEGNSTKSGTRTCLLQITSNLISTIVNKDGSTKQVEKDYIIDPLAPGLWEAIPNLLCPLFSNPAIVKIGHGIGGMDVSSLHRDFGILVVNAFDTYEASAIVTQRKGGLGLANLCKHYGLSSYEHYQDLKQKYQSSDWVKRPLDEEAVEYGRYDVRYLCSLRRLLMRDLVKMDMLGSTLQKFGFGTSSLEGDSGMESNNTPVLQTLDSTMSSTVTTSSTSISDDLNNSSDEQQESKDDNLDNEEKLPVVKLLASELPCYHHLMNAIAISQKRCLKLWTEDDEDEMLPPTLITIIKEAALQKGYGKDWSDSHMQLYRDLYAWRVKTAQRLAISTSEVCTLDLLVHVAYRLPTSRCELRRYSFILPSILEDVDLPYCNEMLDLVMSSDVFQLQQSTTPVLDVVYYSKPDSVCKSSCSDQKRWPKLMLTSVIIGVSLIVAIKSRRR